jgi:RNA polymerase sigma factor (sigma-70 family)
MCDHRLRTTADPAIDSVSPLAAGHVMQRSSPCEQERNAAMRPDTTRAAKLGGGGAAEHVMLDTGAVDATAQDDAQILRVHEALDDLAALDPRLAQVVEMRYFAGLSEEEIAQAMGVTNRTVRRDWDKARTLLFAVLK